MTTTASSQFRGQNPLEVNPTRFNRIGPRSSALDFAFAPPDEARNSTLLKGFPCVRRTDKAFASATIARLIF